MRMLKNARVYHDLDLMLQGESPDFVDIASPPLFHPQAIRSALEAGAHVLCEKPMCLQRGDLESVKRLAADKSRVVMCVHNWKFAPAFAAAKRAIDLGRIGAVRMINADRIRTQPAGGPGQWRSRRENGGGILVDHGWHIFYLAQWTLGGDAPARVSANLEAPTGIDEIADLRVVFSSGGVLRSYLTWRAPVRRTVTTIYGDGGVIEINENRVVLTARSGEREELPVEDAPDDSYHPTWFAGMAEQFESALAAGCCSDAPVRNLAEASYALAIIDAARKSSDSDGISVAIDR